MRTLKRTARASLAIPIVPPRCIICGAAATHRAEWVVRIDGQDHTLHNLRDAMTGEPPGRVWSCAQHLDEVAKLRMPVRVRVP